MSTPSEDGIAIVGLAARTPGAQDVEALWRLLLTGRMAIATLTAEELLAAGVPPSELARPEYVRAKGVLEDHDGFDAAFFGYGAEEAARCDPQQRVFLEVAWTALEDAGIDPATQPGRIGVFAGAGTSGWPRDEDVTTWAPDYLALRAAHALGLRGPALSLSTACSSALVAVHQACLSLLAGECDVAIAGGASVRTPQRVGYRWAEGSIKSRTGVCRPFDAQADGTVIGCGAGAVVLMRADDARGHAVRAYVRGTAINNDGQRKVSFTAPSVEGQAEVIADALAVSGLDPAEIGLIEAHGTGTPIGDAMEVAALQLVLGRAPPGCALTSVKGHVGHLEAAGGVIALIKAVLSAERGVVPGTAGLTAPHPGLRLERTPFTVSGEPRPWPTGRGRAAGVSAFGFGGTNAHALIAAPAAAVAAAHRPARPELVCVSAQSARALDRAVARWADHLASASVEAFADLAWTSRVGRRAFAHRTFVVADDPRAAARALAGAPRGIARERAVTAASTAGAPAAALEAAGRAWLEGAPLPADPRDVPLRRRVSAPTYPFERGV